MAGSGELLRVLLPVEAVPAAGRVLALEVYDDGLIVRFLIPHEGDFPYPPWEGQFALSDDVGTTYRFDGALVGGRPAHGVVTFSPAAPPDARWVDVVSPAGRAHFQLS